MSNIEEIRNKIGNLKISHNFMDDCLGIVLCEYFDSHLDRPDQEPNETGWTDWVIEQTDIALDLIAEQLGINISN